MLNGGRVWLRRGRRKENGGRGRARSSRGRRQERVSEAAVFTRRALAKSNHVVNREDGFCWVQIGARLSAARDENRCGGRMEACARVLAWKRRRTSCRLRRRRTACGRGRESNAGADAEIGQGQRLVARWTGGENCALNFAVAAAKGGRGAVYVERYTQAHAVGAEKMVHRKPRRVNDLESLNRLCLCGRRRARPHGLADGESVGGGADGGPALHRGGSNGAASNFKSAIGNLKARCEGFTAMLRGLGAFLGRFADGEISVGRSVLWRRRTEVRRAFRDAGQGSGFGCLEEV